MFLISFDKRLCSFERRLWVSAPVVTPRRINKPGLAVTQSIDKRPISPALLTRVRAEVAN